MHNDSLHLPFAPSAGRPNRSARTALRCEAGRPGTSAAAQASGSMSCAGSGGAPGAATTRARPQLSSWYSLRAASCGDLDSAGLSSDDTPWQALRSRSAAPGQQAAALHYDHSIQSSLCRPAHPPSLQASS